ESDAGKISPCVYPSLTEVIAADLYPVRIPGVDIEKEIEALFFQVRIFLIVAAVIFPACDIGSLGIQKKIGAADNRFGFLFPLIHIGDNQSIFTGVADAGISL